MLAEPDRSGNARPNRPVLNRRRSGRSKSRRRCCPIRWWALRIWPQDANPFGSLVALYIVARRPGVWRARQARWRSQTRPGDGPAGLDVQEHAATAVRRLEAALLRWLARAVGNPRVVRLLHDDRVDRAVVWQRAGGFVLGIPDHIAVRTARPCSNPLPFAPDADDGQPEHPGRRVHAVHDDDEPRRRQPEPGCDPVEDAPGPARGR